MLGYAGCFCGATGRMMPLMAPSGTLATQLTPGGPKGHPLCLHLLVRAPLKYAPISGSQ